MGMGNEGSAGASMGRPNYPVVETPGYMTPRRPRFMEEDMGLFDEGTPWQTSGITIIGDADGQSPEGDDRDIWLGPGDSNGGRPARHRTPRQIARDSLLLGYDRFGVRHRYADDWINRQMSPELAGRVTRLARSNNLDRLPRGLDNRVLSEARILENLFDDLQAARQGVRAGRREYRTGSIDQQQFQDMIEARRDARRRLRGTPR